MRVTDNGSFYTIHVSRDDISIFNYSWPCSSIPEKACFFQFHKKSCDLVDTNCQADGSEVLALIEDCQAYANKKGF